MKTTNNFIPIHEFARKHKIARQNVYRWIREGRIPKEQYAVEEVVVKRIKISPDVRWGKLLAP